MLDVVTSKVSPVYNPLTYLANTKATTPINKPKGRKQIVLKDKFKPMSLSDFLSVLKRSHVVRTKRITDVKGK